MLCFASSRGGEENSLGGGGVDEVAGGAVAAGLHAGLADALGERGRHLRRK